MFRSYGILISLMGLALVVGLGCESPSGNEGDGGTGGSAGSGSGGSAGDGGTPGGGGAGGMVVAECPPGATAPEPAIGTVPTACRNSFNQLVSEFPVTLEVALDCAVAGQPFNANVKPTLALDTTFLQSAADTLCDLGITLTSTDVNNAQVRVDAAEGATCTSALSVLSPVPQTVELDVTVTGECGAGGTPQVRRQDRSPSARLALRHWRQDRPTFRSTPMWSCSSNRSRSTSRADKAPLSPPLTTKSLARSPPTAPTS